MTALPQETGHESRLDINARLQVGELNMSRFGRKHSWILAIGLLLAVPMPASATENIAPGIPATLTAKPAAAKRVSGTLSVKVHGLPNGAKAKVKVAGQGSRKAISGTKTLKRLKPGKYTVTVGRVTFGGAAFTGQAKPQKVKVRSGKRAKVAVRYTRQVLPTPTPTPTPTPAALRFNFFDAVGVAVTERGSVRSAASGQVQPRATGGQLLAVMPDGSTRDAVVEGSLGAVSAAVIGPDGRVYLVVWSSDNACRLLRVDPVDGVSKCLDSDIMMSLSQASGSPPLQFDRQGAVYYLGIPPNASGLPQLIRNVDGQKTNLTNENIQIDDWLVYADSSVFVGGRTTSTGASWFRRIMPSGGIQNLNTGSTTQSIATYPDGNVYVGLWGYPEGGIRRVLTSTMTVDPTWWLSGTMNGLNPPRTFDADSICTPRPPEMEGFCGWYGTLVRGFYRSGDALFAVPSSVGGGDLLMKYYPDVEKTNTSTRATVGATIPGGVALAGQSPEGVNVITRYDPQSDSEALLVGEEQNVEAYHLNYVAATDSLMFDGLRLGDGKYVIGQVNLTTGEIVVVPSSKMASFQTFG